MGVQNANSQTWEWARWVGMPIGTEGFYCATDANGNVYGSGNHWGAMHFGTITVPGAGAYIVKYNSVGDVKWAISTNSIPSTSGSFGMITDIFGNEYLLGIHDTTLTFGSFTITNPGTHNNYYFLSKIDSSGNVKWLKNLGNLATNFVSNGSNCITSDELGNIYITCSFTNSPTIGGYTITNRGMIDVFVGKFDSSGNVIWAKGYGCGSTGGANTSGIAVTPSHKIYVTGYFNSDSLYFGGNFLVDTSSTHTYNTGYLAKLDSNGNPIWARGTGGSNGGDDFTGVVTDSNENVFFTGSYFGSILHFGTFSLPYPPNGSYGFLAKYDSTGSAAWVKLMQGNFILPWMPALDPCGNIWIISTMSTGRMTTNDTIDGHILAPPLINGDPNFIACWSKTGTFLTASPISSGSSDDPNGISIDKCGNIYVIADKENCDTLIIANDSFITVGGEGMFIAKYNPNFGCSHCGYPELEKSPDQSIPIDIYPNPTKSNLTISTSMNITSITISSIVGQIVYSKNFNSNVVQVDIPDLPMGIYIIKVNDILKRKFIKE